MLSGIARPRTDDSSAGGGGQTSGPSTCSPTKSSDQADADSESEQQVSGKETIGLKTVLGVSSSCFPLPLSYHAANDRIPEYNRFAIFGLTCI